MLIDPDFFHTCDKYLNPDNPEDHAPPESIPARLITDAFCCGYKLAFHCCGEYAACLFEEGDQLRRTVYKELTEIYHGPNMDNLTFMDLEAP